MYIVTMTVFVIQYLVETGKIDTKMAVTIAQKQSQIYYTSKLIMGPYRAFNNHLQIFSISVIIMHWLFRLVVSDCGLGCVVVVSCETRRYSRRSC